MKQEDINDDINENDEKSTKYAKKYGFHWQWICDGEYDSSRCKQYYQKQSKFTDKISKFYIIIYFALMIGHVVLYVYKHDEWVAYIARILELPFIYFPIGLSQICPCLILLKYQLSLYTLNMYLKCKEEMEVSEVLKKYRDLYIAFTVDMAFWSIIHLHRY